MRRRKKLPTRRRKALWSCAALGAAVLLVLGTGIYRPLPIQGALLAADELDVQDPVVIRRFRPAPDHAAGKEGAWMYLLEGRDALLLCGSSFFGRYGWTSGLWCRAETWNGAGLYGGLLFHDDEAPDSTGYLFGKIDDPEIRHLQLRITAGRAEQAPVVSVEDLPDSAIFSAEGSRYFLLLWERRPSADGMPVLQLVGLSEEGTPLRTGEAACLLWG